MAAASKGHVEVVDRLLATHLLDVNAMIGQFLDAIVMACREGRTEAVRLLLKAGADVSNGMALKIAKLNGRAGCVTLLQVR